MSKLRWREFPRIASGRLQWAKRQDSTPSTSNPVLSNSLGPMDCSTPGFPVLHYLQKLVQTHINWVSDFIQPAHPLSPPSPLALNLSLHQGIFQWIISSHQVAKVLELQLQYQSFKWIFRVDFFRINWFDLLAVRGTLKSLQKIISLVLRLDSNYYLL